MFRNEGSIPGEPLEQENIALHIICQNVFFFSIHQDAISPLVQTKFEVCLDGKIR